MLTRVKICGLCSAGDARLAAESGADYAGVVLSQVGPRWQTPEAAAAVFAGAPRLHRVGVFVDADAAFVERCATALGLRVVQLHGSEDAGIVTSLRGQGPWRIWKAIRLRSAEGLEAAIEAWAGHVDGLLLEGWSEKGHGGVGAAFDREAVASRLEHWPSRVELVVAGGLRPDNVGLVIRALAPDTVDVSSGVESSPCHKSRDLVKAFVENARLAFEEVTVARNGSR